MSRVFVLIAIHMALALAAPAAHAQAVVGLAEFSLVADLQRSPLGAVPIFNQDQVWTGRVHLGGSARLSPYGYPLFTGPYSQTSEQIVDMAPGQFDQAFQGGLCLAHAPLAWNFAEELDLIRQVCPPEHRWAAVVDSLPLTTLIRFDGPVYHAAQFSQGQVQGTDTLYTVPWTTLPLPAGNQPQLIWVEGVARVKGVVEGQVTLLASDSLFIMGDVITADTILSPCPSGDPYPPQASPFGTVPVGSPNRIGLIGEQDVLIAATLENGFANGASTPAVTCGMPNEPVVSACSQGRRDLIITASILAGCSFGTEFWKTTAWAALPPAPYPQWDCGDSSYTHVRLWDTVPGGQWPDCPNASSTSDRRGTLWFYGSLAVFRPGYNSINPPGAMGNVWVGYQSRRHAHDANLLRSSPPYWPTTRWLPERAAVVEAAPETPPCGLVEDPAALAQAWAFGVPALHIRSSNPEADTPLHGQVRAWVNDEPQALSRFSLEGDSLLVWRPELNLHSWMEGPARVWFEVETGDFWGWDRDLEVEASWNVDGAECAWFWVETTATPSPAQPAACRLGEPWPNPFNPGCQVTVDLSVASSLRLEVFDLLGRREALVFDGLLPAGAHAFTLDGASWPAGLHLLRATHVNGVELRKVVLAK
jgi:hypothetical protein